MTVETLHRCIVDFTEGVDCILFKAVNDVEVALSHLYGGVSEEARHRFYIRSFGEDVYREAVQKKYRFFSFGDAMFITNDMHMDDEAAE